MFNTKKMATQATPARVYALLRILQNSEDHGMERNILREKMMTDKDSDYSHAIEETAFELGIFSDDNGYYSLTEDGEKILNIPDYKLFVISKLPQFRSGIFYKVTQAILSLNGNYLYSENPELTTRELMNTIQEKINDDGIPDVSSVRAWRFWASYIGLGFTFGQQKMIFVPNASNYLEMVIKSKMSDLIGTEMNISTFLDRLGSEVSLLVTEEDRKNRRLKLAVSSGLSNLHSKRLINIWHELDEKEVWTGQFSFQPGVSQISRITYLGENTND